MVKEDGARAIPDSPWEVADLVREFDYRTQVWGVDNEEAAALIEAYRDREVAEALAGQASVRIDPDRPEAFCHECGRSNTVWFAPNPLWNRVMGSEVGILCPVCFAQKAEACGEGRTGWRFEPEDWDPARDVVFLQDKLCDYAQRFSASEARLAEQTKVIATLTRLHDDWRCEAEMAQAYIEEQAGEIERLTLGLRRIVSDAEQCAAWAKDEQRGRQAAQFETLVGIARAVLGAASGQEGAAE
jgi:hypothetical protein